LKARNQFLSRYAAIDATALDGFPRRYARVLVVPAFAERPEFYRRLLQRQEADPPALLVLVLNAPEHASIDDIDRTAQAAQLIARQHTLLWQSATGPGLSLHAGGAECPLDLLCLQRFATDQRLPCKQGVGLARRLGADLAAHLIATGKVHCPWIFNSDADAVLPRGYFEAAQSLPEDAVGLCYPFDHQPCGDNALDRAVAQYEASLQHYVNGLKRAGSDYAFHTIGSCMAVELDAYTHVRGFPKRAAGEDFYLLNKLAKLGAIVSPEHPVVKIRTRASRRVPFGTGPAIARIAERQARGGAHLDYHPQVFASLRLALEEIHQVGTCSEIAVRIGDDPQSWAGEATHRRALCAVGFPAALNAALKTRSTQTQYQRHMHDWFDAFRQLKFIHYLSNHEYPKQPLDYVSYRASITGHSGV